MAVVDPLLKAQPLRRLDSRIFDDYFFNQVYIHEYSTVILILAGYKFFTNWLQKQQEASRLEREKITAEIQLLKTQVNPDFLFTSLERLGRLTLQKSNHAPQMILRLAHLLRYVLYESLTPTVPLAWEIDVIEDYVFIQRMLQGTSLEVSFTVRGPEQQPIAPLLLFPIVEYAFSHLPDREAEEPTWVSIDLAVADAQLSLKVIGELACSSSQDESRTSLDGLRKQLAFYYPDRYQLQIQQEDQLHVVSLHITFPSGSSAPSFLSEQPIVSPDDGATPVRTGTLQ
jgi:LytS/YehU family sensor histidine kinase